jgi:hypothetical protein
MDDVKRILALLDAGGSPAIGDLEWAEERLRPGLHPGSFDEAVARWRIVVKLEQLSRARGTAPVVA